MRISEVLSYGLLGLPLAFGALPVYLFVPDFYSKSALLDLSVLGWILLATRLIDAIADPLFGWLIDRVHRLRFLCVALIPFAVGFVALFNPSDEIDPVLWLLASLIVCTLGFSAAMIAYQAWGGDLGMHSKMRLHLTGSREAFGLIGVLLASILPSVLSDQTTHGIKLASWFFLPLVVVCGWLSLRFTPHSVVAIQSNGDGFGKIMGQVLKDRIYRRLLCVFVANGTASAFPATLFVFYVADVLGMQHITGLLLGLYFLSAALSVPLWIRLAAQIGRAKTWFCSMLLAVAAFFSAAVLGSGDWKLFSMICVASGLAMGADLAIPGSIVADLGERQGRAASYFGVWNLVAKFNLALAAGVALPLIGFFGYAPGRGTHIEALVMAYVLLPVGLKLIAMNLIWVWRKSLSFNY